MTKEQIVSAVMQIVAAQMECSHCNDITYIPKNSTLIDLGLDELSSIEVIMSVEEAFKIELADDAITLSSTINGISNLISHHIQQGGSHE